MQGSPIQAGSAGHGPGDSCANLIRSSPRGRPWKPAQCPDWPWTPAALDLACSQAPTWTTHSRRPPAAACSRPAQSKMQPSFPPVEAPGVLPQPHTRRPASAALVPGRALRWLGGSWSRRPLLLAAGSRAEGNRLPFHPILQNQGLCPAPGKDSKSTHERRNG